MGSKSDNGLGNIESKVTKLTGKNGPYSILIVSNNGLPVIHVGKKLDESTTKAAFGVALENEIHKYSNNYSGKTPINTIIDFKDFKLMINKYEPFIVLCEWHPQDEVLQKDFKKGLDDVMVELIEELT